MAICKVNDPLVGRKVYRLDVPATVSSVLAAIDPARIGALLNYPTVRHSRAPIWLDVQIQAMTQAETTLARYDSDSTGRLQPSHARMAR
jgi:hypothetical protein